MSAGAEDPPNMCEEKILEFFFCPSLVLRDSTTGVSKVVTVTKEYAEMVSR